MSCQITIWVMYHININLYLTDMVLYTIINSELINLTDTIHKCTQIHNNRQM